MQPIKKLYLYDTKFFFKQLEYGTYTTHPKQQPNNRNT